MKAVISILKILCDILLMLLAIAALTIVGPNIFGVKTLAVLSGSMEPQYPVGSMVFAVPTEPERIELGDPISFVFDEKGTLVTHRVVEVNREERNFIVRGDANNVDDPKPVAYENIIGVVRFHVPMLGFILGFILTAQGKIVVGTVIVSIILLTLLLSSGENQKPERGKQQHGAKQLKQQPPSAMEPPTVPEHKEQMQQGAEENPVLKQHPPMEMESPAMPERAIQKTPKPPKAAKNKPGIYSRNQRYVSKYNNTDD